MIFFLSNIRRIFISVTFQCAESSLATKRTKQIKKYLEKYQEISGNYSNLDAFFIKKV